MSIPSPAESEEPSRKSLGQWLIENMTRGTSLEVPVRDGNSRREVPFADWGEDDWCDESDGLSREYP